jgi:hypothetical protein
MTPRPPNIGNAMTHNKRHVAGERRSEGEAGNFKLERGELPRY